MDVLVYDPDPRVAALLLGVVPAAGRKCDAHFTADETAGWLEARARDRGVIVFGPGVRGDELRRLSEDMSPGIVAVQVLEQLEAGSLREAIRLGVRDVVAADEVESELPEILVRAAEELTRAEVRDRAPQPESPRKGHVVTVFGSKGGVGKTTTAVNLAVASAKAGVSTALVDANLRFGDCAGFLRLRPNNTLGDLAGIKGVDRSMMDSLLTEHQSGLRLVCAPKDPFEAQDIGPDTIAQSLTVLASAFDLVVVDTAPGLEEVAAAALDVCDLAILVTSLELPAVKDARLCLDAMERLHLAPAKVRVVLNRADSKVGFPATEVSKALKVPVAGRIPSDVAVPRSLNGGEALVTAYPRSKSARAVEGLARDLLSTFDLGVVRETRKGLRSRRSLKLRSAEA